MSPNMQAKPRRRAKYPVTCVRQKGAALLILLIILILGTTGLLLGSLNRSSGVALERDRITVEALVQAKEALIGNAASQSPVTSAGYLRLPDLGPGISTEGSAAGSFSGNNKDYSVIGKVPWKTFGISPLRDGQGECLWYVVSGRFKNTPKTDAFNWDTQGQINVIDGNGSVIASNIAALLVAPGQPVDGQSHVLSDPAYTQCGGNYDARNYLDSYDSSNAISGEVNYFTGSTNSRVALNANNKRFVLAKNDHYNDQFLFVTTDDIFRPIIRRSDFRDQISALMNDPYFQSVSSASGSKGTGNITCNNLSTAENRTFCANWLEMLLLTKFAPKAPIIIDGAATPDCKFVLIFGGQKSAVQVRRTATEKGAPANYLEGANLTSFAIPTANKPSSFNGASIFNANNPSADLLRCIP